MAIEEQLTPEEAQADQAMQETPTESEGQHGQEDQQGAGNQDAPAGPEGVEPEQQEERQRPPEGFVPHGALHAEREARKRLQSELEELKRWREEQQNPPEQPPQYVDPIEDPEGFRKWAEHNAQQPTKTVEQLQQEQRQVAEHQQRIQQATRLEQEFAAKTPDYGEAVQWLQEQRINELRGMGYSDQEIGSQIQQDANGIFNAAQASGMNPAELLYLRAKSSGFQARPAPVSEAQKMEAQAKAQQQTQGLGSGGGAPAAGKITAAQLAEMSEDELAKVPADQIQAAFGG